MFITNNNSNKYKWLVFIILIIILIYGIIVGIRYYYQIRELGRLAPTINQTPIQQITAPSNTEFQASALTKDWKIYKNNGFQIQYPGYYEDLKNIRPDVPALFSLGAAGDEKRPGFQINVFPLESYIFYNAPSSERLLYDLSEDRWLKNDSRGSQSYVDLRSFVLGNMIAYEVYSGDAGHGKMATVIPLKNKNIMFEIIYFTDPLTESTPPVKDMLSTLNFDKEADFYSFSENENKYRYINILDFSLLIRDEDGSRRVNVTKPIKHGDTLYINWENDTRDSELPISIHLINFLGIDLGSINSVFFGDDRADLNTLGNSGAFFKVGTHIYKDSYEFIAPPGDGYVFEIRLSDEDGGVMAKDQTSPFSIID